jgi:hypothetical protein
MNATLSGGFTMRSARIMFLAVTGLLAGLSLNLRAEVKTEEKS